MPQSQIAFLDTTQTVAVDTPLALFVSWGDRVSRSQSGPSVYGPLERSQHGTPSALCCEAGELGDWWSRPEVQVRGYRHATDGHSYTAELTDEQRAAALATYHAVAAAWRQAVATDPEIAAAVEAHRQIQDSILADHAAYNERWEIDLAHIAQKFGRNSVSVGEQTVPGKCCVRSARGKLLGYAHVRDGRWLGTVERI
jgi:hypothetical protein